MSLLLRQGTIPDGLRLKSGLLPGMQVGAYVIADADVAAIVEAWFRGDAADLPFDDEGTGRLARYRVEDDGMVVGLYVISSDDMDALVEYWLTNTDLEPGDLRPAVVARLVGTPRPERSILRRWLATLVETDGWNTDRRRLVFAPPASIPEPAPCPK